MFGNYFAWDFPHQRDIRSLKENKGPNLFFPETGTVLACLVSWDPLSKDISASRLMAPSFSTWWKI